MAIHAIDHPDAYLRVLPLVTADDVLLLLGAAVTLVDQATEQVDAAVYALDEDLGALGITAPDNSAIIDYAGWVALTKEHPQFIHWR